MGSREVPEAARNNDSLRVGGNPSAGAERQRQRLVALGLELAANCVQGGWGLLAGAGRGERELLVVLGEVHALLLPEDEARDRIRDRLLRPETDAGRLHAGVPRRREGRQVE